MQNMYSINVRYKANSRIVELFKDPNMVEYPIELIKLANAILDDLEKISRRIAYNSNVYIFGAMKDIFRASDLKDFEKAIVKRAYKELRQKLEEYSKKLGRDLFNETIDNYIILVVAETVLLGNHFKLSEQYNHVLLVMRDILNS